MEIVQKTLHTESKEIAQGAEPALLRVSELKRYFDVSPPFLNRVLERQPKQFLKAVDGISFEDQGRRNL